MDDFLRWLAQWRGIEVEPGGQPAAAFALLAPLRRAHAAHVERDARLAAADHLVDVVADLDPDRDAQVEVAEGAASVFCAGGQELEMRIRVVG